MKMQRVSAAKLVIAPEGAMRVPAHLYVSELLEETLDQGAIDQTVRVAQLPGILGASIAMPDAHIGYGFPIGGVAAFDAEEGIISPGGIGFDINCGVRLLATNLRADDVAELKNELLELIQKAVPTGSGRESSIRLSHTELDEVLRQGAQWALAHGYATERDIERTEERGCLAGADPVCVSHRAKDRGVNQLGTLGSGNHFLELQRVETILDAQKAAAYGLREGQLCVLIHCGSRGVGHQICSDSVRAMLEAYPEENDVLADKNLAYAPIQSELGVRYRKAMAAAANYAWCNRQLITHHVRNAIKRLYPGSTVELVYDVSHNIAKFETYTIDGEAREVCVHRKGATRAFAAGHEEICEVYRAHGQPVLVPGSMGTASYVLAGAQGAMDETFGSCCHGAGRALSRTKALATIDGMRVKQELSARGITVKASTKGASEEAPAAYKDVDEVIRVVEMAGIATSVARLVPIGVVKG
jgi:tRNA-splicing ligase RtcB